MLTPTTAYRKELGDGLVLKSLAAAADVERLAEFQGQVHGPGVAGLVRELVLHHPHTRPRHWLYVEDEGTGQIVSGLCLIPWTIRYEEVTLQAGEMGIVATLEPYRRRGLVRAQAARHAELLREEGFDLSHIQGIPYFYRQFGYEYAMPLEGGWHVDLQRIGDPPASAPAYTWRLAALDDVPLLARLYGQSAERLAIHTVRDEAEWRYLLGPSTRTEMVADTWLAFDAQGAPAGYLRVPHEGFGEGLIVNEASPFDTGSAPAVLAHLKALAVERAKPYVRLCLPGDHVLIHAAHGKGDDSGHYAWQIKIVDVARLLRKLAPAFERRIAASPYAGLSYDFCLDLYREAFELRFRAGRLAEVVSPGPGDGATPRGGIRLPPPLLAPLLLGYRSREELARTYHDVSTWGEWQQVVDVVFPKMGSFLYTVY